MDGELTASQRKTLMSQRSGLHATVFGVRRDPQLKNKDIIRDSAAPAFPFVGGYSYKVKQVFLKLRREILYNFANNFYFIGSMEW